MKWKTGGYRAGTTPITGADGTIYVGNKKLYAIYPENGTVKWSFNLGENEDIRGSNPCISADGTIYFGTHIGEYDGGEIIAVNSDGTEKWRKMIADLWVDSAPAIGEDGTIYFGHMDYDIIAVNPNGTIKWRYSTGFHITGGPAISDDGTIYIGSGDTYFYAMNPNGTLKWRFKTGHYIKGPPSIADDGTIYIGSFDDYLYALYPNGTLKWKCNIGTGTETNPSIASDGTIYVGSPDGHLYAIYPNGTLKWSFAVIGDIHQSSPTISADETIYFGTDDSGYIYAVNPNGTEKWRKKIANKWVESSPSIAEDGTVYIGSSYDMSKGYLHAFGNVESNQPPGAPVIDGPSKVNVGEMNWFTFRAVDPDRNPIRLYVDWEDGNNGWVGEYASGETMWQEYAWNTQGTYEVKAKVKDVMGEESGWGYFEVTVTRNKATSNVLFLRFLERFPLLERLLYLLN